MGGKERHREREIELPVDSQKGYNRSEERMRDGEKKAGTSGHFRLELDERERER